MGRPQQFEHLGRAIKARRAEAGMSRKELAEEAGISYSYLSEIENGVKPPSTATLMDIAAALDVEAHQLMERGTRLEAIEFPSKPSASPRGPSREERFAERTLSTSNLPNWLTEDEPVEEPLGELMQLWRSLSFDDRRVLLDLARRLSRR